MPLDLTTISGGCLGTNEQVAGLIRSHPDLFIGFASVDPHKPGACELLEYALDELRLSGLVLHPAQQRFKPNDESLFGLYELCAARNKPIVFHAGMTVRPGVPSSAGNPMLFEDVILAYPKLRICLQHFGWPWVRETCLLLFKYRSVYTDLSCLYFDNPREFYGQLFCHDMGSHWIDRSLRHQVMFASEEPRLEMRRMIGAIREQPWRPSTMRMVLGENAQTFIEGGEIND